MAATPGLLAHAVTVMSDSELEREMQRLCPQQLRRLMESAVSALCAKVENMGGGFESVSAAEAAKRRELGSGPVLEPLNCAEDFKD